MTSGLFIDLWWTLNPTVRCRLCDLLNKKNTGLDYMALAEELDLRMNQLEKVKNPTDAILKAYEVSNLQHFVDHSCSKGCFYRRQTIAPIIKYCRGETGM